MDIIFTNTSSFKNIETPQLASKLIPQWYKDMPSYIGGEKKVDTRIGTTLSTSKRCMPIFDAITAGYIITSPADVQVSLRDGIQYFEWASFSLIDFHPVAQALGHPAQKGDHAYPKWKNFWSVKTPKGYSTLFVPPMHRESVFTILSGIVDTDKYYVPVHFPFVINDPNFEGIIPKGTPIAQAIPFKRESWNMKFGGDKIIEEQEDQLSQILTSFFDKYKNMFRQPKEYG
jgi:hypothetical protein